MTELGKQLASMLGTTFAAVCCLGVGWALAALSAIGAGFLINDALLIPLFAAFLGLNLWLLRRSARRHGDLRALTLSAAGALAALGGLFVSPAVVYAGLAAMIGASFWDFALLRLRQGARGAN
ncbi:MAG: MerC domain-containing protein [Betaproteobacteria bacterium]